MLAEGTLKGRTAVITGGGSGIGLGIAKEFARLGANVVIASRKQETLDAGAAKIREAARGGAEVATFVLDVRHPDQIQEVEAKVAERFGRTDILVNNAAGNFVVPASELSVNGWKAVIDIVLNGTFFCTQAFGKRMIESGKGGNVLNIVATYVFNGGPGVVHSASAKAGVLAMTQTLAVEWAMHRIRVNAIAPGPIAETGGADKLFGVPEIARAVIDDVPLKRLGTTEEIGWAASYLVSDYGSYVNGECLVVDGGAWLNKGMFKLLPT